jgi:hypothetical protein
VEKTGQGLIPPGLPAPISSENPTSKNVQVIGMNHHDEREELGDRKFDELSGNVIGCAIEVHRPPV